MATLTRTTDDKARVSLPRSFANATVVIEMVSECEVRIRRARVVPEDEAVFAEQAGHRLSNAERDAFLALLDAPAAPTPALKKAVVKSKRRRG